jgi:hypothetical protein
MQTHLVVIETKTWDDLDTPTRGWITYSEASRSFIHWFSSLCVVEDSRIMWMVEWMLIFGPAWYSSPARRLLTPGVFQVAVSP